MEFAIKEHGQQKKLCRRKLVERLNVLRLSPSANIKVVVGVLQQDEGKTTLTTLSGIPTDILEILNRGVCYLEIKSTEKVLVGRKFTGYPATPQFLAGKEAVHF